MKTLPLDGPPRNCVELVIFDDDGPEGYFQRLRFERSHEAIEFIMQEFTREEIPSYNFTLTNYWKISNLPEQT